VTETAVVPDSPRFVQYLFVKTDPLWRRLPQPERERGRDEFACVLRESAPAVTTHAYSTLGLKTEPPRLSRRLV
jgi:chlorite dismutase